MVASFPGPTECTDALEGIGLKPTKRGMSIRGKEIRMHWNEEGALSVGYIGTITTAGIGRRRYGDVLSSNGTVLWCVHVFAFVTRPGGVVGLADVHGGTVE